MWMQKEGEDPGNEGTCGGGGIGSSSLEKCRINPKDVYQLSFNIFILRVIGNLK